MISIRKEDVEYRLFAEQWIPAPLQHVFDFFSDARNLEAITPSLLRFRILSMGPIEMKEGTTIQYRLKIHGVPVNWISEITAWEPPYGFVDTQVKGPYKKWVHEHRFREVDGGTLVEDRVGYAVPGGRIVNKLFVQPDVEHIFMYRHNKLLELFREKSHVA